MFRKSDELVTTSEEKNASYIRKKENAILRTYEEPVMPLLCKLVFWIMLLVIAAMLLVDLNAFVRYDSHLGLLHLYHNIVMTGFWGWLIFSVFLLPLCGAAIRQAGDKFRRQKRESGIEETTEEDRARNRRALKRLNRNYIKYMQISGAGLGVWTLLYLIDLFIL